MTAPNPSPRADAVRAPVAAVETRARDTAVRGLAAPGLLGPLPPARRSSAAASSLLPPGPGSALPQTSRARAEAKLGIDLSEVRIHAGAAAAQQADTLGANAFALGDDVVFARGKYAPGTAAGEDLLLHELAHVAQARTGSAPAEVMRDEPPRPRGIGAAPPREAFDTGRGVDPETGHVLFERDDAVLDPGDLETIQGLMRDRTRRLWVDVTGYASQEGDAPYNANLSAHRAVAVRHAIEPLLPPGSLLDVHAHGEVADFGPVEENRRVGIRVREAPELASLGGPGIGGRPGLLGDFRLQLDPALFPPGTPLPPSGDTAPEVEAPTARVNPFLDPSRFPGLFNPGPGPLAGSAGGLTTPLPSVPTGRGVDWFGLARAASLHGGTVDLRDAGAAEAMRLRLYYGWLGVVGPGLADTISRSAVTSAYEQYQSRENPNQWDLWKRDDEARGTSVRGLSIDLLDPPWKKSK